MTLPKTGTCHNCGQPTAHRFCDQKCNREYYGRKRAEARKHRREQSWKRRGGTDKERIESVIAKAKAAGTCYAETWLAPERR